MGTCRYCNQSAGFLRKLHGTGRNLHTDGIQEMNQLAAQAAGTTRFNETALRGTLQAIATRARATEDDISQAIAVGFAQAVNHALADGTLTAEEEANLRTFRDRMANQDLPSVITGFSAPGTFRDSPRTCNSGRPWAGLRPLRQGNTRTSLNSASPTPGSWCSLPNSRSRPKGSWKCAKFIQGQIPILHPSTLVGNTLGQSQRFRLKLVQDTVTRRSEHF